MIMIPDKDLFFAYGPAVSRMKTEPITIFKSLKDIFPTATWPYTVMLIGCKPLDQLASQPAASKRQVSPDQPTTLRLFTGGNSSAAVAIPVGALAALTELISSSFPSFTFAASAAFATAGTNYSAAGPAILLLPHGTTFNKIVGVTLQLPAGLAALIGSTVSCSATVGSGAMRRAVVVLRRRDDNATTPWEELPGVGCTAASASQVPN